MLKRPLGATGIEVSALGLGGGSLGRDDVPEEVARELLDTALDLGVTLIDTAVSYGESESRIGRWLEGRRAKVVLSTKGGYGAEGARDWTGEAITLGIEGALGRLQTDHIDVFHLHSCPKDTAMRDDIGEALEKARGAGKIRVAAYSGEGEALEAAVRSPRFGSVQCSVSLFDQKNLEMTLLRASHAGLGVIAKRPLANAVWQMPSWPEGEHADYWERMKAMQLEPGPDGWLDLAMRFSAFSPGVSASIVGTQRAEHLVECAEAIERGDLPMDLRRRIETTFSTKSRGWTGKV